MIGSLDDASNFGTEGEDKEEARVRLRFEGGVFCGWALVVGLRRRVG